MRTARHPRDVNESLFWDIALKTDPLTKDQEQTLGKKIQAGKKAEQALAENNLTSSQTHRQKKIAAEGRAAKTQFVEANLKLAMTQVRKFWSPTRNMDPEDLVAEATIALHKAVDKFEWERGLKFSSYAVYWILGYVTQEIANQGYAAKIPVAIHQQMFKGHNNWKGKVAGALKTEVRSMSTPLRLNKKYNNNENEDSLGDVIPDRNSTPPDERITNGVEDIIKIIEEVIEDPLNLYFIYSYLGIGCEPLSFNEIGKKVNMAAQNVSARYYNAIRRVRNKIPKELSELFH